MQAGTASPPSPRHRVERPATFHLYRMGDDPRFWWRMTRANGRWIARSADAHATATEAFSHLAGIVGGLDELTISLNATEGAGWCWSLVDKAGVAQVMGSLLNDRRIRSVQAAQRFIDLAGNAVFDPRAYVYRRTAPYAQRLPALEIDVPHGLPIAQLE